MIKVGNVWYLKSQKKQAMEAARNRRRAWVTELRKRILYGTYQRNNRINSSR